jgi:hypothetical protein
MRGAAFGCDADPIRTERLSALATTLGRVWPGIMTAPERELPGPF